MKELFKLLTDREKRMLGILAGAAVLFLLAFLFVSLGALRSYGRSEEALTRLTKDLGKARVSLDLARTESGRWEEAKGDLEAFRTRYFYDDKQGIRDLRLDLEKVFAEAGIRVSEIGYKYADLEKGKARKVVAGFTFRGHYATLKRFLAVIERFPKFLILERIDFLNTGSETGALELKIELAGYYET
jgi:hypothetical protein